MLFRNQDGRVRKSIDADSGARQSSVDLDDTRQVRHVNN